VVGVFWGGKGKAGIEGWAIPHLILCYLHVSFSVYKMYWGGARVHHSMYGTLLVWSNIAAYGDLDAHRMMMPWTCAFVGNLTQNI
jgi:hypothetical protein